VTDRGPARCRLTGLFSFGMGISNQKELNDLYDEMRRLYKNQQKLLHHLRSFEVQTRRSFKSILNGVKTEHLKARANFVFETKLRDLRQVSDKLLVGLYQALMGRLDPHLVSAHELRTTLDGLEKKAKVMGLKLAPLENDIKILFSLPITTLLKDRALHMWLTVPLVSVDSPIFDIFSVTHEPIPHKGLLFGLEPRKPYLAVDARKELHLNFDEVDLNA